MADTYVQLPADSTGQKLRMESAVVGGATVLQQVSTLADASGNLVNVTSNALNVNASGTVSVSNFPTTGDATAANQATLNTEVGALTETAPTTDTASSGLNGRLQRIAQRLSSLIGLFPGSLGQKTSANSFAVTVASDQSALPVTGTFWQTTQPVSGSVSVSNFPATQPVSGTVTATGPLTDTQLRASAVPVSTTALPSSLGQQTAAGALAVVAAANTSILQGSTATSTTGAQLTVTSTPCAAVEVYNLAANTSNVLVGNSSNQLREIIPGAAWTVQIDNVNKVYVKSASGTPTVVWTARNG